MSGQRTDRLVFIDETGASTKMARRYGWGPRCERVISDVPHGHWKTTTFVGALRTSGMTAPTVIDGAMNGELFLASVEQQLVPTLRSGDIVVMDKSSLSASAPNLEQPQARRRQSRDRKGGSDFDVSAS